MIIVVQPHSDDAYLSLHQHILSWVKAKEDVKIITLWDRRGEGANYADAVGASHQTLYGGEHHPWVLEHPDEPWSCHRSGVQLPLWPGSRDFGITLGDTIYSPAGLEHLEHIYCRRLMECIKDQTGDPSQYWWYHYLDTPYWGKRVNQGLVQDLFTNSLGVEGFMAPCGRKYMKKWLKLFPSQGMFFHFNLNKLKNTPEIILDAID